MSFDTRNLDELRRELNEDSSEINKDTFTRILKVLEKTSSCIDMLKEGDFNGINEVKDRLESELEKTTKLLEQCKNVETPVDNTTGFSVMLATFIHNCDVLKIELEVIKKILKFAKS